MLNSKLLALYKCKALLHISMIPKFWIKSTTFSKGLWHVWRKSRKKQCFTSEWIRQGYGQGTPRSRTPVSMASMKTQVLHELAKVLEKTLAVSRVQVTLSCTQWHGNSHWHLGYLRSSTALIFNTLIYWSSESRFALSEIRCCKKKKKYLTVCMDNELQRAKYTFMDGCQGKGARYFKTFPERRWNLKKKKRLVQLTLKWARNSKMAISPFIQNGEASNRQVTDFGVVEEGTSRWQSDGNLPFQGIP